MLPEAHEKQEIMATQTIMYTGVKRFILNMIALMLNVPK